MTTDEQDLETGRLVREIRDIEHELVCLRRKATRYGTDWGYVSKMLLGSGDVDGRWEVPPCDGLADATEVEKTLRSIRDLTKKLATAKRDLERLL